MKGGARAAHLAPPAALVASLGLALASTLAAGRLEAQARPALVSALEGKATRARDRTAPVELRVGSGVAQGDVIATGEGARLEIRFADRSLVRLGPGTRLQLTTVHFSGGPARRQLTAKLLIGTLWAKVTSVLQGDQKFQVEMENAIAGVRGTTFRVESRADKSALVRVYDGAVAVAKGSPAGGGGTQGGRREVEGPAEVSRDQWEKIVGRQMELVIAPDGTPGDPRQLSGDEERSDDLGAWTPAKK